MRRKSPYQMRRLERAFERADKSSALKRQDGRCFYCKAPLRIKDATRDHYVPRSKGGSDLGHNIVASCFRCNQVKDSMSPEVFLKKIKSPKRGDPIEIWLIHFELRVNEAVIRLRKNLGKRLGIKL